MMQRSLWRKIARSWRCATSTGATQRLRWDRCARGGDNRTLGSPFWLELRPLLRPVTSRRYHGAEQSEIAVSNLRTATQLQPSFAQATHALQVLVASIAESQPEPAPVPKPEAKAPPDTEYIEQQQTGWEHANGRSRSSATGHAVCSAKKSDGTGAQLGDDGAGEGREQPRAGGMVELALAEALAAAQADLAASRSAVLERDVALGRAQQEIARLKEEAAHAVER
jgi:hypothetical protein